ncbi:MAG TPA: hypothetical protein VM287_04435 [Egibacteraceae bacterium]|nr:hypothetical protein [Egibacteraceae bacterium]
MYRWAAVTGLLCLAVLSTGLVHIAARASCAGFTARWSPRLYDADWVEDQLLARGGYPQDILDEGYHALPEPLQRRLVDCLVDALIQQEPLPAGTTAEQEREVRNRVYLLIFDKENLSPLWQDVSDPVPVIGERGSVIPQEAQEALDSLTAPTIPPGPGNPPRLLPEALPDIAVPSALLEAEGLPGDLHVPVDVQPPQ